MRDRDSNSESPQLWGSDDSTWERARHRRDRRLATPAPAATAEHDTENDDETQPEGELVLLFSIVQAAKALGVGRSTIYELIGMGDLEVVHIGRSARIPVETIRAFVRRLRAS